MLLKLVLTVLTFLSLVCGLALENGGSDTSLAATTVWFTTTQAGGAVLTLPSIFSQSFMETYSEATAPAPSGGILEVSSLGNIRTYPTTTVTNIANSYAYSGIMGLIALGGYML